MLGQMLLLLQQQAGIVAFCALGCSLFSCRSCLLVKGVAEFIGNNQMKISASTDDPLIPAHSQMLRFQSDGEMERMD